MRAKRHEIACLRAEHDLKKPSWMPGASFGIARYAPTAIYLVIPWSCSEVGSQPDGNAT